MGRRKATRRQGHERSKGEELATEAPSPDTNSQSGPMKLLRRRQTDAGPSKQSQKHRQKHRQKQRQRRGRSSQCGEGEREGVKGDRVKGGREGSEWQLRVVKSTCGIVQTFIALAPWMDFIV